MAGGGWRCVGTARVGGRALSVVIALALAASVLVAGGARTAEATESSGTIAAVCTSPIGPQHVLFPFRATGTPDRVQSGEQVQMELDVALPSIVQATTKYVSWVDVTWPLPPETVAVESVSFSTLEGWTSRVAEIDLPADGGVGSLTVRHDGGEGTSTDPSRPGYVSNPPSTTIAITVASGGPTFLVWHPFTTFDVNANTILGDLVISCQPDYPTMSINEGTTIERPLPSFTDVPPDNPFFVEITTMAGLGVAGGFSDGTFRPTAPVTRQAMAAFIYRLAGEPPVPPPPIPRFSDVPAWHPFRAAIEWAAAQGITDGYADGTFRPTADISRQGMAAFFYRMVGEPPPPPGFPIPTFWDVPPSNPFRIAIGWTTNRGITTGYPDGSYRPTAGASRQVTMAFLFRFMELVAEAQPETVAASSASDTSGLAPTWEMTSPAAIEPNLAEVIRSQPWANPWRNPAA